MRAMATTTALLLVLTTPTTALVVTRPVTYDIPHIAADFSARTDLPEIPLVMAIPADGCSPIVNDVAHKVVLVLRGHCRFVTKARVVHQANASGMIVMDDIHRGDNPFDDGRWEVRMSSEDNVNQEHVKHHHDMHLLPSVFISHTSGRRLQRHLDRFTSSKSVLSTPLRPLLTSHDNDNHHEVLVALNATAEGSQHIDQGVDWLDVGHLPVLSSLSDLVCAMLPYMGYAYASSFCFILLSTFYARAVETSAWYIKQYARRSIWTRLSVVPYRGPLHHGADTTCSICLDDFVLGHVVKVLPCPHVYHQHCIDRWFEKGSNACPLCKRLAFS
ncbi:hypothetical protein H257_14340 [Aphanomyces astaci]|uniref:RING-type domain-containing protein n=1 Tax=Aphanomyces astaci TaxID=112090 RepID=W4FR49_APHAT|nr:hypothetical protein H257_14340 [Aphanomyces astaci]ETV69967.1 hypothetical protein H257_14340 [Aphanomyces astaci]|eukprot:XP_009840410.1 hypothetical protein H257_14340 [Aphanomyces astaci]